MPTFSKTRILYYTNSNNNLVTNDIKQLTVRSTDNNNANPNYNVVEIPYLNSSNKGHGWYNIPMNSYGLYLTTAEMISLYENFDSFHPTNLKITIGHAVPLAKYPNSTGTTQLSFNNTIYSLICDLPANDMVTLDKNFTSYDEAYYFYRTLDGTSFKDGTSRQMLPTSNLLYKIPVPRINPTTAVYPQVGVIDATVLSPLTSAQRSTFNQALTEQELKLVFYPELLQDNRNIKALYPGENQDVFDFVDDNNPYAKISCTAPAFGECFQYQDLRNWYINYAMESYDEYTLLNLPVFPRIRGPVTNNNMGFNTLNLEPEHEIYAKLATEFIQQDQFHNTLGHKLIKGLPILDETGNIISHQFCVTITFELNIQGEPRKQYIPSPLKFQNCYLENLYYYSGLTATPTRAPIFRKRMPLKPFHEFVNSKYRMRLAIEDQMTATTINDFWKAVPSTSTSTTWQTEEIPPNIFTQNVPGTIKTNTFIKNLPASTLLSGITTRNANNPELLLKKFNEHVTKNEKILNKIDKSDITTITPQIKSLNDNLTGANNTLKRLENVKLDKHDLLPLYEHLKTITDNVNTINNQLGVSSAEIHSFNIPDDVINPQENE